MKKNILSFGIRSWLKNTFTKPNKNALFIFGFQKSGTSVIAGLLAEMTGKSVTIDTPYFWYPYDHQIISGTLKIKDHVEKYSHPFSKQIIKEQTTIFFISKLQEYFILDSYCFIIRNPFDNIRSILNRLNLLGNKEDIDIRLVIKSWQYIFKETEPLFYLTILLKKLNLYSI